MCLQVTFCIFCEVLDVIQQIFMIVLSVKCYLDCRFTGVLCVNTSKVEDP